MFTCMLFFYRGTITCENFEELCEDLWEQLRLQLKKFHAAGMKIGHIYMYSCAAGDYTLH